jgi:phosphatidylglycerol---prolipoprotein diacylglyceryl transferase
MRPVLYRFPDWIPVLGDQPITTFGVMLLVAFLGAGALFVRRLRSDQPAARGGELVVAAALGGLVGAKVMHLLIHTALGLPAAGFGRGGLNWFGGLAGGAAAVLWQAHRSKLPLGTVAGAAATPLLLGLGLGRVGSFLVGADYGLPTTLPWGVTFPAGTPPTTPANLAAIYGVVSPAGAMVGDFVRVHPTQLYEAALALFAFAGLEIVRRARGAIGKATGTAAAYGGWRLLGWSLILSGLARLPIELLRAKQDHLVGPVTVDLLLALAVTALGAGLVVRHLTPGLVPTP